MTKSLLSDRIPLAKPLNISSLSKAVTTVSCSGFDFATWPNLLAAATKFKSSNCTSSSNYVIPVGITVKTLANQNFAAAGGRRNEKMGVFVAGVPSSLAPVPLLPRSCFPSLSPFTPATQATCSLMSVILYNSVNIIRCKEDHRSYRRNFCSCEKKA